MTRNDEKIGSINPKKDPEFFEWQNILRELRALDVLINLVRQRMDEFEVLPSNEQDAELGHLLLRLASNCELMKIQLSDLCEMEDDT